MKALIDAGPLVAITDPFDTHHGRCREALAALDGGPFLTSWPAMAEAMYLVGRKGGYHAQEALWGVVRRGAVAVGDVPGSEWERLATLMKKYRDLPMDLADASLLVLAEREELLTIFTLDSDFEIYRVGTGQSLHLVP